MFKICFLCIYIFFRRFIQSTPQISLKLFHNFVSALTPDMDDGDLKIDSKNKKYWNLAKESELRLETDSAGISIRLLKGTAELFGAELCLDKIYKVTSRQFAIFTWHGAEILVYFHQL